MLSFVVLFAKYSSLSLPTSQPPSLSLCFSFKLANRFIFHSLSFQFCFFPLLYVSYVHQMHSLLLLLLLPFVEYVCLRLLFPHPFRYAIEFTLLNLCVCVLFGYLRLIRLLFVISHEFVCASCFFRTSIKLYEVCLDASAIWNLKHPKTTPRLYWFSHLLLLFLVFCLLSYCAFFFVCYSCVRFLFGFYCYSWLYAIRISDYKIHAYTQSQFK